MHAYVCDYVHPSVCVCVYMGVCMCARAWCMCVCVCACTCVYVCVCVPHMCSRVWMQVVGVLSTPICMFLYLCLWQDRVDQPRPQSKGEGQYSCQ